MWFIHRSVGKLLGDPTVGLAHTPPFPGVRVRATSASLCRGPSVHLFERLVLGLLVAAFPPDV